MRSSVRIVLSLAVLAAVAGIPRASGAQESESEVSPGAAADEPLPREEDEVQGTCLTPRQAYLQLLWWAKKDPRKAAICFDTSRLKDAQQAPKLARRLLDHLDGEGIRINTEGAPTDPDYVNGNNRPVYRDPKAPEFEIARYPDGRWLFTPESLENIPSAGVLERAARYLPDWFHSDFLGVKVWKFLAVILLFFIAFTLQKFVVFVIRTYVRRLVESTNLKYLESAVKRADRPIGGLAMAAVLHFGFPPLGFPLQASQVALVATKALAAFSMVWLAYRLIDVLGSWMDAKAEKTDTKLDDQLVPLVTKTFKVFVSVIGFIFVLQNLSVDVGSLLAGVGLGGLAFALAAKDTIANFFGSIMIFVDKPFQIGDWIVVNDVEGTVEEVGFRTTRIRTFYNSLVTVPNSIIPNTAVDNYGKRQYRRYTTTLGLTYDTPVEKVQAFCEAVRALIARSEGMRKDYYLVEFKDFGASSLNVMLYCFMISETWNQERRTRTELNLNIMCIARDLGVSFAFPTQTVHVETLARSGEARASHSGPSERAELVSVIDGFGPKGERAAAVELSEGYDCGPRWESS